MVRPKTLEQQPSKILLFLGGVTATLLLTALLFLAPAFGLPFLDLPRLIGGVFTADPTAAFWLGCGLFFAAGVLIFPPLLGALWSSLPGEGEGFMGALAKGAVWGLVLGVLSGLLLPLLGALHRLEGVPNPGLFALSHGLLGPVLLLLAHVGYGVALALVGAMAHGISPQELIGWESYRAGEKQKEAIY